MPCMGTMGSTATLSVLMLRVCDARSPCRGPALQLDLSLCCTADAGARASRIHADYVLLWDRDGLAAQRALAVLALPCTSSPPRQDGDLPAFGIGDAPQIEWLFLASKG